MRVARIYADESGESHFDDVELAAVTARSPTGVLATVSESLGIDGLSFREVVEEASDVEPHVAPARLLIMHLEGTVDVEASDGEIRRFGPGDAVLVEDTHGRGHVTRKVGDGPRRTVVAPLRAAPRGEDAASLRIAIVGAGAHGRRIANAILDGGRDAVVAVADPALAGTSLHDAVGPAAGSGHVVADARELPVELDLAIVAAAVDLDGVAEIAIPLLDRGVDVITLSTDAFDPPVAWAERVDAHARKGGARFLATGVQDVWWVHLPSLAAGSMASLRAVDVESRVDLDTLPRDVGGLFGVGRPPTEFVAVERLLSAERSVIGGPLRVLARRLGLTPGEVRRSFEPLVATVSMRWRAGSEDVDPGRMIGFVEVARVDTDEGVELRGALRTTLLADGDEPADRIVLEGDPTLRLEQRPFPGQRVTDVVPVARIEDLRRATPGLLTAAMLPAPAYRHPGAR